MKTMRFTVLLSFIFLVQMLSAQDVIVKTNGDSLAVKITEVGTVEVKYKYPEEPDGPLYAIEKAEIRSITYQSGRVEYFERSPIVPEPLREQKIHALKVNLLSPIFGYTKFSYEHVLKPGRNLEVTASIIGLGNDPGDLIDDFDRDQRGLGLSVGYKFTKQPDYYVPGMKLRHLMHGAYAKPTLHLGYYNENYDNYDGVGVGNRDVTYIGAMVELGKQWVFSNSFLIDLHFGLGIGGDNLGDNEAGATHWGLTRLGQNNFGAMINGGFKVGFLLGKPREVRPR